MDEAKVGETYDVTVEEEFENQWTGALGIAKIGDVRVPIPKAKKGEKFKVKITSVGTNQWTNAKEAKFEIVT